jgi:hypothetical protein
MRPDFRVVALVAAYNEADVIEQVVADLIEQGIQVYALDDRSTDGTAAILERFVGRGVLAVEPVDGGADGVFDWERILRRKSALACELDADWFIHHDADEFRESPWRGVTLREAIARVEAAGFNAIDFASLDFWPTHDRFRPGDDLRQTFTRYAEASPCDRVQVRCWKKTAAPVDLASSGGHDAQFHGRRVFPLRFISRHYPIRSQAHGVRKVFDERVGRFRHQERARGWHVQYDGLPATASFVRDADTLSPYDPDAVRMALVLRHRGVEALEASLQQAQRINDERAAEVDRLRDAAAAAECELQARRADIERLHAAATALRLELDAVVADREAVRRQSDARQAEIVKAADFIAGQREALDRLQHAVADLERRLEETRRSVSWRITAPARILARALRGR